MTRAYALPFCILILYSYYFILCVCMCVCTHRHAHVCKCTACVCMCGGQGSTLGVSLYHSHLGKCSYFRSYFLGYQNKLTPVKPWKRLWMHPFNPGHGACFLSHGAQPGTPHSVLKGSSANSFLVPFHSMSKQRGRKGHTQTHIRPYAEGGGGLHWF